MCKWIAIVYFLLFVAKIVECVYIPEDDDKNTESNEKSEETARNQETHNSNETSETTIINDDKLGDEPEQYDRSERVKETEEDSATEETNRRFADSKESTVFVGSLAKTLHDALSGENVSEDVTVARTAADNHQEESTETTDPGEIFVYTPQQSQDPVLDLKARTGRVDEDDKEERDNGSYHDEARIGHLPRDNANNNRRSGYEAPGEDNDDDWKLTNPQQRRIPTSGPSGQSFNYQHINENRYPSTSWKSKIRPENNYHHSPRLSPIYEGGKSRELLYPSYNSREHMGQTNSYSGNLMKSYFGLHYPNRQLFTGRSREMCSSCNKDNFRPIERARSGDIYSSPDDHGYRRSIYQQNDAKPLDKANGRSEDHDPSAANDYPLQLDHNENTDVNRAHSNSWSHETMDPGKNGRLYSKDVEGSFPPKIGPLTKMLMNLPSYNLPRNSQMARMGLARASRSIL